MKTKKKLSIVICHLLLILINHSTGLGPLLLRKRRSKSRRAPAPPIRSVTSPGCPEEARLLDEAEATASTSTPTSTSAAGSDT